MVAGGFGDKVDGAPALPASSLAFPVRALDRKDPDGMLKLIDEIKPKYVVLSHDIWMFPGVAEAKLRHPDTVFVGYLTIDSGPPTPAWRGWLASYDGIVVPAEYGREQLLERWFDIIADVVPYGVDKKFYHPPKDGKEKLKEKTYDESIRSVMTGKSLTYLDMRGKFTAAYLGMNLGRKNVLGLVEAWREFEKGKDDVALILMAHTVALQMEEIGHYPPTELIRGESVYYFHQPMPEDMVGSVMSFSNVLLHPSVGEGFGLPILEAMACGTVPIVTDYSAMHDLCDPTCAYMIQCVRYAPHGTLHICVPDLYDISEALETAYADWKSGLLETKSKVAAERALGYSWDNTAWRLKESLEKFTVIAEKRKNGIIATRIV